MQEVPQTQNQKENKTGIETRSPREIVFTLKRSIKNRRANNIEEANIIKFIDEYLTLNGMHLQNFELLSKITYSIRLQSDLVDINSISKALTDWGIENELVQIKKESIELIKEYWLSMLIKPYELIVLLHVDNSNILYLSSNGSVNKKSWSALSRRWTGLFLISKLTPISKIQFSRKTSTALNLVKGYDSFYDKIIAIISKGIQNSNESIYYILLITTSPVVYLFYKLKFRPLYITFIWIILRYIVVVLLFFNQALISRMISVLLILLSYVFEVCQGTLARFSMQESELDAYLVKLGSLTSRLMLITSISMGLYESGNSKNILIWGGACILSDVFFQTIWENRSKTLSEERSVISNAINSLQPLNPNIFILGLLFNILILTIEFWTILAFVLTLWVLIMEFIHLFRSSNTRSKIYSSYTIDNIQDGKE